VRLFFDEDTGKGIPKALRLLGQTGIEFPDRRGKIRERTADEDWLPFVGRGGYLLFSCNTAILETEGQRNILVRERVGAVFLTTGQARSMDVLRLILNE